MSNTNQRNTNKQPVKSTSKTPAKTTVNPPVKKSRTGIFIAKCAIFVVVLTTSLVGINWSNDVEQFVNVKVFQNNGGVAAVYGDLTVHFIDVGQADAIAVIFPNNKVMMVDSGVAMPATNANPRRQAVVDYLNTYVFPDSTEDKPTIDWFVLTHSDFDHVGGAVYLFNNFTIPVVYRPAVFTANERNTLIADGGYLRGVHIPGGSYTSHTTNAFADFVDALYATDREVIYHQYATDFKAGGVDVDFYRPQKFYYSSSDVNSHSPYIVLTYKSKRIMLTGDATDKNQEEWLHRDIALKIDILKVQHHGSADGNDKVFFDSINPTYAVISVGAGNSYNHPNPGVLQNMLDSGILPENTYRTDLVGDIIGYIDGTGKAGIALNHDYQRIVGADGNEDIWIEYWILALILVLVAAAALFADNVVRLARNKK